MKSWLTLGVVFGLAAMPVCAWEVPENPDRYISLAFNADKGVLDGSANSESDLEQLGVSLRVPFVNNATVDFRYEKHSQDLRLGNAVTNFDGNTLGMTVRFYLVPSSGN